MPNALDTLCDWIAIDSVTGHEGDYGDALARHLVGLGFGVERQDVEPGRFNVLSRADEPELVFCTHLDTVPPYFGPTRKGTAIHGRGACDAKGPALAMIEAARRLVASGERRIGFLFTVGEETDGGGAQHANKVTSERWKPRWTIIGEPTDNRFIRGGKGVFKGTLSAHGVASHSSRPLGPSAIHELVHVAHHLLEDGWGEHPLFGKGTLNLGLVQGGLASNVVAPAATASVMVRVVEEPRAVEARIRAHLTKDVEFTAEKSYGPVEFFVPDAHRQDAPVVAFGTDAPWLTRFGTRLLYGPGSIDDAHTDHERLAVDSFERAVGEYERTARELLARS
ncbi:MAG: M20/M25/M40 family metallo-hydrolase [Planctomycetes bacterium]|nr:M20/M25/M40 family metallo-hydrolase [Planctomycetota bacterium]